MRTFLTSCVIFYLGCFFLPEARADLIAPYFNCRQSLQTVSVNLDVLHVDGASTLMLIPAVRRSSYGLYLVRWGENTGYFFPLPGPPPSMEHGMLRASFTLAMKPVNRNDKGSSLPIQCVWNPKSHGGLPACDVLILSQETAATPPPRLEGVADILDEDLKLALTRAVTDRLASIKTVFGQAMDSAVRDAVILSNSKDSHSLFLAMRKSEAEARGAFMAQVDQAITVCKASGDPEIVRSARIFRDELETVVKKYRIKKR